MLNDGSFEKQRRNLFITSIALFFIMFANVSISEVVKTSYITITIGKPEFIIYFLLLMHVYFMFRFVQSKNIDTLSLLDFQYQTRMYALAKRKYDFYIALEISYKDFKKECDTAGLSDEYIQHNNQEMEERREISPDIESTTVEIIDSKKNRILTTSQIAGEIERVSAFKYRWQHREGRSDIETATTYYFSNYEVILSYLSIFKVPFTNHFSTYNLPLFLATIVCVIFSYRLYIT